MILEMKIPSPGESINEVEIASWLVKDGDYVEKNQPIAEVDSDKATLELPAEESGTITLVAQEGDVVAVGSVACKIDTDAKAPESKSSTPAAVAPKKDESAPTPPPPVQATKPVVTKAIPSPAAKKIIAENNINISSGTGKDGRITKDDAIKAVASMGSAPTYGTREQTSKRLSVLRRKIADRLVSVKNETAMLTTFNEIDMSSINSIRAEYKDTFYKTHNVGLGFMSFFTKAVTRALELFPDINSALDGSEQIMYDFKDISVAVSSPKGLMVPVVRNAELLTFRGVEKEIKRLAIKARDGQLSLDEMTGGTFTITNGGVFGSMLSTPIINPPQSAILGMHNVVDRAVVVDGSIVIRPIMYVALSYDHRIVDGKESVSFLVAIKEALENPTELLMDNDIKKALEL